jgi:hypothetical protein
MLGQPTPKGFARWNGPLIAKALGDVDVQYIWRSLRKQKIDLAGRKGWWRAKIRNSPPRLPTWLGRYTRESRPQSSRNPQRVRFRHHWYKSGLLAATGFPLPRPRDAAA